MGGRFLLAIDQGTSSSRAVLYDHEVNVVRSAQQEFAQHYPQPGWVEHDLDEIWEKIQVVIAELLKKLDELGVERVARRAVAAAERIGARLAGECAPSAGGDR